MADKKLADIIQQGEKGDVVLLGFPHDRGVEINGGRVGARFGPEKFRVWLTRSGTLENPEKNISLKGLSLFDAGDIPGDIPLEEAHDLLTRRIESILGNGAIPVVVGGGNDQSYPNASGLLAHSGQDTIGVVNIDAHLDVRPLSNGRAHSGSSFRQLLEDSRFRGEHFIEFACQGHQCGGDHAQYIADKKGRILWLDEVQSQGSVTDVFRNSLGNLSWSCSSIFVSFDLDAIAGNFAPGVSCPGVLGLTAEEALKIAFISGSHPKVRLFDISEYNPLVEEERTGRLATAIFYYFCLGVASRIS